MAGAEQAGWQGYMRQESRAFALAVFLEVTGDVPTHLPSRAAKLVRKCQKPLKAHADWLDELRVMLGKLEEA